MQKVFQSYLRKLTNLTTSSRSILLLKLSARQFIDVHEFDFLDNNPSFSIIKALIQRDKKIKLCDITDSRSTINNDVSTKLKQIFRTDKFINEERGSKDLYVGWPFVQGKFNNGNLVRTPLLFFPVSLEKDINTWHLKIRADIPISFNKSFLLAYAHFNEVQLAEDLIDHTFENASKDIIIFKRYLYDLLNRSNLDIHFNQDTFVDKLQPFISYIKSELDEKENTGRLKLFPEAVLGIFPQADSYLVPDYLKLIQREEIDHLETFFLTKTKKNVLLDSLSKNYHHNVAEEDLFTPFEIDAYQEKALKHIKIGESIVVHGPPGTGKSQLICNLIADSIARGKPLLLICQKRVALDVVYERLEEIGMADFIALVHDFKNDRKDIYKKIYKQINRLDEYKLKNNGLDAIQLERRFLQISRRIDQIVEELEMFKEALFDTSEAGVSVKELYLSSNPHQESINLKEEYNNFRIDDLNSFLITLKQYGQFAFKFLKPDYPWKHRKSFHSYTVNDLKIIQNIVKEIPAFKNKFDDEIKKIILSKLSFQESLDIIENKTKLLACLDLLDTSKIYETFKSLLVFPDQETDLLWFNNVKRILFDCYQNIGPEISLATYELGRFQEALQHYISAKNNFFKKIKWHLSSKDKFFIKRVAVANGLKFNKEGIKILTRKIDNRLNLEHNLSKLSKRKWIKDIPSSYLIDDFKEWFANYEKAIQAKLAFNSFRSLKNRFSAQKLSYYEFRSKIEQLIEVLESLNGEKKKWEEYLTTFEIERLFEGEIASEVLLEALHLDFEDLCAFDHLTNQLKNYEKGVIKKLVAHTSKLDDTSLVTLFENSIRLAWIEHIEAKHPVLRIVTSMKFNQLEHEMQQLIKDKLKLSIEIAMLRAREKTYEKVEYNRLNNLVTYRDLQHQVAKKRKIWPIRKLIKQFHNEIFQLVSCWMVSPESASAIFPLEELFDTLVFDEASQCFAEKGLPAMYRAKQVVVVGDDKQLSPNDLYQTRWNDGEEDDMPELSVDSLLDLTKQFLSQVKLQQHYRSKSLDLITFSNIHFYDKTLTLLPSFKDINNAQPAIQYIKVDGVWDKNINLTEAEKVVELVEKTIKETPQKDIGIITFNSKQQELIKDLLEEQLQRIPESLMVKNIENVQGDEKDIIIFSIGYAPDKNERLSIQFGSLNLEKGENRLNVAVTRAREKILVVTSIWPQQLNVEASKNEGPKLLKAYLNYAKDVSDGNFRAEINIPQTSYKQTYYLKDKIKAYINENFSDLEAKEELPFVDLTIRRNEKYVGVIFSDDNLYFQSISAKDIHAYKPFILRDSEWPFSSFYSRVYWLKPAQIEEKLKKFVYHLT